MPASLAQCLQINCTSRRPGLSTTAIWSAEGFPPSNRSALRHTGFQRPWRAAAPAGSIRCGKRPVFKKALCDRLAQQILHRRHRPAGFATRCAAVQPFEVAGDVGQRRWLQRPDRHGDQRYQVVGVAAARGTFQNARVHEAVADQSAHGTRQGWAGPAVTLVPKSGRERISPFPATVRRSGGRPACRGQS